MSVVLSNSAQNPFYNPPGSVIVGTSYGVLGEPGIAWTVTNGGAIEATATNGIGVTLASGGYVTNQLGGAINGGLDGVLINGGTVHNNGNVSGGSDGIVIVSGNGSGSGAQNQSGDQNWGGGNQCGDDGSGQWGGGDQWGGNGSGRSSGGAVAAGALVNNNGTVEAGSIGISITVAAASGSSDNRCGSDDERYGQGGAGNSVSGIATVINSGVISAGTTGILIDGGSNGAAGGYGCGDDERGGSSSSAGAYVNNSGAIFVASGSGIVLNVGGSATLVDSGFIQGGTSGDGIDIGANIISVNMSGAIFSYNSGIVLNPSSSAMVNSLGQIQAGSAGDGIAIKGGAGDSVITGGMIIAGDAGVLIDASSGQGSGASTAAPSVYNYGQINANIGILVKAGGSGSGGYGRGDDEYGGGRDCGNSGGNPVTSGPSVSNSGLINGTAFGVQIYGSHATVTNSGLITVYVGDGVMISGASASVANSGLINAGAVGVYLNGGSNVQGGGNCGGPGGTSSGAAYLSNTALITGYGSNGVGVNLVGAGSIVNGTHAAMITGTAIGVEVAGYDTITNNGSLSGGIGVLGGPTGHNTLINAGAVIGTGGTAVSFSGPDNLIVVEPGSVFVGQVQGGGGDTMTFAAPGTDNITNVAGFSTFTLANGGANTLALTDANFAGVTGRTIAVYDGNGGNAVDGSSLSTPDKLVVHAGSGADMLLGGAANDTFYAGGDTTMTGRAGTNLFVFSAPGNNTIADFAASATNEIAFSSSGFHLGLHGSGTPRALPSNLFVSNATGSFTSSSQRFAYDTANGDLFYSPHGKGSPASLVTQLSGDPTLTASHLFFVS